MSRNNFKEIKERSARLIDAAGLAAFYTVGTDDFMPRFADLLCCFKSEYAEYLYAVRGIDPLDPRLADADNPFSENTLLEVSTYFSTACDVLDADFVRRFDPTKTRGEYPFFAFLDYIVSKRAAAAFASEQIADTRRGMSGMTREQSRLLSAALRAFESVCEVTDEILIAAAEQIGCDIGTLREAWIMNRNANAESLDAGEENDEGDFVSLYDKVSIEETPDTSADFIKERLALLDALLTYERPTGAKKADFELSKSEKQRFPLLFTNRLILGWVDELKSSDPEAKNRRDILENRFDDLKLEERLKLYSDYKVICPEIFALYIEGRTEVTIGMLAKALCIDQSGFSGIESSVSKKLALYSEFIG